MNGRILITGGAGFIGSHLADALLAQGFAVPLFPYPGSPVYEKRWGVADELAWERAHAHDLAAFRAFSEIQEQEPLPLAALEVGP